MIDPRLPAMDVVLNKVCVLVTAAFALTLVPDFRRSERSLLSIRDRGTALLVFMILGLAERAAVGQNGCFNHRIVAVCLAGLLAGPSVGGVVAAFLAWAATTYDGRPLTCGISMMFGALAAGLLHRWRPRLAQHPLTGFCFTCTVLWLREGLTFLWAPEAETGTLMFDQMGVAPVLQGLGTALILAIVALVRDRDEQSQAAVSAEVRALQSRMNPHFLSNALNTLAALATVAPREIPTAVSRLRHFLRAAFDQPERALAPLEEELTVVRAYLDIESLRLNNRLKVEQAIDPGLSQALIPPFSLQPLMENAVRHGLPSSTKVGSVRLVVRRAGTWLVISISDDGKGVAASDIERIFFAVEPRVHALTLLRRRLQGLFGRSFRLDIQSDIGKGTTVTMRIPFQRRFEVANEPLEAIAAKSGQLA